MIERYPCGGAAAEAVHAWKGQPTGPKETGDGPIADDRKDITLSHGNHPA
jgi:hypothetical protein